MSHSRVVSWVARKLSSYRVGLWGEYIAIFYMRLSGYSLLEHRYRSPRGEVDLVLFKGDCLFFVEVKTSFRGFRLASCFPVSYRQVLAMVDAYKCFIVSFPRYYDCRVSFDVCLVSSFVCRPVYIRNVLRSSL